MIRIVSICLALVAVGCPTTAWSVDLEVVSGLITAVGLNSVKVVENPLVKTQPKTIKTDNKVEQ